MLRLEISTSTSPYLRTTSPRITTLPSTHVCVVDGKIVMHVPSSLDTQAGGTLFGKVLSGLGLTLLAGSLYSLLSSATSTATSSTSTTSSSLLSHPMAPPLGALALSIPLLTVGVSYVRAEYDSDPAVIAGKRDAFNAQVRSGRMGSVGDVVGARIVEFAAPDELRAIVLDRVGGLEDLEVMDPGMLASLGVLSTDEARWAGMYAAAFTERRESFNASIQAMANLMESKAREANNRFKAKVAGAQDEYNAVDCVRLMHELERTLEARLGELRKYQNDRIAALEHERNSSEQSLRVSIENQRAHALSTFEQINEVDQAAHPPPPPSAPPAYNSPHSSNGNSNTYGYVDPVPPPPPYSSSSGAGQPPPSYDGPGSDPGMISRKAARKASLESELQRLEELERSSVARMRAALEEEKRKVKSYVADQMGKARSDFSNHVAHLKSCVDTAASIRDASIQVEQRRLDQALEEMAVSASHRTKPLKDAFLADVERLTAQAQKAAAALSWTHLPPSYSTYHLGRDLTSDELAVFLSEVYDDQKPFTSPSTLSRVL